MKGIGAALAALVAFSAAPSFASAPDSQFDAQLAQARNDILGNPEKALSDAATLRAEAASFGSPEARTDAIAQADWVRAEALISLNQPKQATTVINNALASITPSARNTAIRGELMLARGVVAVIRGRVQDALRDNQNAFRLFDTADDRRGQAIALQNIGTIYTEAGDYNNALKYFDQSAEVYSQDPKLLLSANNNRGSAYYELKRYKDAEAAFQKALASARSINNPLLEIRILQNLAATQAEAGEFPQANATIKSAIRLSAGGPAAAWRPAIFGVAARVALLQHDLDEAASLIERTFAGSKAAEAMMPMRDFHRTAYEIYRERGEAGKALTHLEAFKRLDDEQRSLVASTSAALLNARFNFANQEVKIARLDKEKASAAERFRNVLAKGLLSVAAIISTLLLIGFLSIRRSRNQVRDANATLSATNVALEKALAAKTEFLATTSHEIRTPLNGILGMTQVILAGRALDPTLRGRIELVHGAGETMKALVDDILDVAKMETGELSIHPGEMDLKRLLEDAVTVWTGQAETKRIGIEFDLDHCPGKIIADEVRLRQIIFNLMSNAIKFTDRGHVRLAALSEEDEETGKEKLVIRVADSGIGIPPDRIEDIFESFRQVDGGVTRRHGGTGLGLAICRSLARAMGGDVEVASVLGTGSTFTLTLPLERCAAEIARADRAAATSLAGAELLMIEPNPLGQGIMRALLAGECANLHFAGDVPAALELLGKAGIDHVIAEGSGLGLDPAGAGALAAACAALNARFTLLWREPSPDLLIAFRDHGVTHVVAKPISAPDLLSEMNRVYGQPIASRNIAA
jgi:signal transduction histidine kinase/predicted negative regulator of RcsB-dependent stress response/CheY-like chemotaxis protein